MFQDSQFSHQWQVSSCVSKQCINDWASLYPYKSAANRFEIVLLANQAVYKGKSPFVVFTKNEYLFFTKISIKFEIYKKYSFHPNYFE